MEFVNNYFIGRFTDFFSLIEYNIAWGILLQAVNILSTLSWSFMDLFIILISVSLSCRFTQIAKAVAHYAKKAESDEKLWRKLREDYTKITILCSAVDDAVSNIMLLSFANNIFVILVQLFNTLQ